MELLPSKENFYWTDHAKIKMRQYRLSESRVKRILRFPKRLEVGVAPDTVAGMQPAGSKKHPYEIWVMWTHAKSARSPRRAGLAKCERAHAKIFNSRMIKIISAWRYPGISPVHEPPPIPEDVWEIIAKDKKSRS